MQMPSEMLGERVCKGRRSAQVQGMRPRERQVMCSCMGGRLRCTQPVSGPTAVSSKAAWAQVLVYKGVRVAGRAAVVARLARIAEQHAAYGSAAYDLDAPDAQALPVRPWRPCT